MGMEHEFSSPRTESFPAGLRVLVVDDDPTWLKILEKMLKKCCYEVTTCGLAREALKLLRDRKDGFDIVISDVNMPDMDGFRLLEHVGLEMDLPVIMMSVDGETSRVMKGVQHGACDYLLKPIRMKELKNIWQHVVRKRMHEVSNIECIEDRIGTDHSFDGHYGSEQMYLKKRKDVDKHDEKDSSDTSTAKKARVVWTVELHQKFVKAVNQLGIDSDKIGPKKILDLMNVPWLTRENVASHLQKYRLYLSRIRKEDNLESSYGGGMKIPDQSPKESSGSFTHNSCFGQHNDITSKYKGCKGHQLPVQTSDSEPLESNMGSSKLLPLTEKSIPCSTENKNLHKSRNSQLDFNHTNGSLDISMQHASFDSSVSGRYRWGQAVSDLQFQKELEPHPKLDNCFRQPVVPIMQPHINPVLLEPAPHIKPNLLDPAPRISTDLLDTAAPHINSDYLVPSPHISPGPVIAETNSLGLIDIKPLNAEAGANNTEKLSSMESPLGSFPVSNSDAFGFGFDMKDQNFSQGAHNIEDEPLLERVYQSLPMQTNSHLADAQGLDPGFDETLEMKKQSSCQGGVVEQSSVTVSESEPRNQVLWSESVSGLLGEDLIRWQQCVDVTSKDFGEFGLDFVGFSGCNFPENDYGSPWPFYVPKLDNDYPFDSVEYPLDQRLLFS